MGQPEEIHRVGCWLHPKFLELQPLPQARATPHFLSSYFHFSGLLSLRLTPVSFYQAADASFRNEHFSNDIFPRLSRTILMQLRPAMPINNQILSRLESTPQIHLRPSLLRLLLNTATKSGTTRRRHPFSRIGKHRQRQQSR